MTDSRAAFDEDRLPWLEEVEDEDAPSGVSAGIVFGLAAVGFAALVGNPDLGFKGLHDTVRLAEVSQALRPGAGRPGR